MGTLGAWYHRWTMFTFLLPSLAASPLSPARELHSLVLTYAYDSHHTDPDFQVNLNPLDSNSHTIVHLLLILSFSSPQLLEPFPCVSGTQDLTLSKISSKLKFFPNPPVFLNVREETFIPIEDIDFLVAFSNGGCFCPVSLPLGTRLDRCRPSYSLQSQILNFIY